MSVYGCWIAKSSIYVKVRSNNDTAIKDRMGDINQIKEIIDIDDDNYYYRSSILHRLVITKIDAVV